MLDWLERGSAVLVISLSSQNTSKDIDFLESLTEVINEKSIEYKNGRAVKTIDFIDGQLVHIVDSMRTLSFDMQDLKLANRDLSIGSGKLFQKINDLEEERYNLILANQYLDYLDNYIRTKSEHDVIAPVTIGLNANLLNNLIIKYVRSQDGTKGKE